MTEDLKRYKLKPNHSIRGFILNGGKKLLSGSFKNYGCIDIDYVKYNTGLVDSITAVQINDYIHNCSYVIYGDIFEIKNGDADDKKANN